MVCKLSQKTNLIALCTDYNKHIEGCSLGKEFIRDTFLLLPVSISAAVQVHKLPNVGVEVKSNVITIRLSCLEIYLKPVKKKSNKNVYFYSCFSHAFLNNKSDHILFGMCRKSSLEKYSHLWF